MLGGGGEVEGEQSAVVAEELGGADAVSEAEFLADTPEEWASHVGRVLLDEGERVAIGPADVGAVVADGKHGLLFRQG